MTGPRTGPVVPSTSAGTQNPSAGSVTTALTVGGMTCASCSARVARRLDRLDGVSAEVNYATGRARVTHPATLDVAVLVDTVRASGYTASPDGRNAAGTEESDAPGRAIRTRVLGSLVLTVPVVLLSMVPPVRFTGWQWVALVLAVPVVSWGALPIHRAAWRNARHGAATMDTLVSLGIGASFLWSVGALVFGSAGDAGMRMDWHLPVFGGDPDSPGSHLYLEVATAVTVFVLAGRWAEARAGDRAGAALRALLALGAKDAAVLRGGREVRTPVDELAVGDVFLVRPGERIATDGVVVEGSSAVDASLVTGESVPVEVGPGDEVTGATGNAGGRLLVRATRVGSETTLARIAQLVQQAQHGSTRVQRLADRVSAVFVPVVLGLALATLGGWLLAGGGTARAFTAAVAVLVIGCPCALGLATPTALLVGTGRGAQLGILVRGPKVLESTRRVDTVVLDKTGTLTTARLAVTDVVPAPGFDAAVLLRLAGAVEDASEHPVGTAVAAAARAVDPAALPAVEGFAATPGLGVSATVDGIAVSVGRREWVASSRPRVPGGLGSVVERAHAAGRTPVWVGFDGELAGVVVLADTIRPDAARAVARLRALGLSPVLVTGDNERAARAVADSLGIREVLADALPSDKVAEVRRLQARGRVVAMLGDGVNDAAALAAADVGLALGTGTDVAIEASDLTLVAGDPLLAADAIRLSRATLRVITGNLVWAFAYNLAALPLAVAGVLDPLVAGAAMAFSSVFVVTNSLRLRRFRALGPA